ncbi:amidohydrolase family protein [Lentiprolixibacter aurantiacus]|uniref:Amidohydrolase family protein n=1 Tax=Lentiprolixibacter aurantiacus TaxID=2993939 RepID=A0AAE3MJ70_9FLAO|nr:amidohydrolase family protein [Lentiprolixibacter aurantiacus]MCX2718102.1 amidohydrolase family protein [Lentiprolixibacter aurantiacus]
MIKPYFLLVPLLILSSCRKSKDVDDTALLLLNARIINVLDGSISDNQSILIQDGKIESIGAYKDLKGFAVKQNHVDIENRFVIPGLWDSHVHIDQLSDDFNHSKQMLSLYTLNGITSIREMGGDWTRIKKLKQVASESHFLPTVFSAGPIFENKAFVDWVVEQDNDIAFGKQRISVSKPEEVPSLIDSVINLGVDFIKVRTAASPEVFFEIAKQCRKYGVKFCGHVDAKIDLYEAVNAGISSLEHIDIFQLTGMNESKMDSIVSLMKSINTYYCPTLTYFKQHRIYDKEKINAFLDDSTYATYPQRAYASKSLLDKSKQAIGWAQESQVPWKKLEPNFLKFAKKLNENNVSVLAGTDGANALVLPGFSLHEELALYSSELEMENLSILQSATINPARYFGLENLGLVKKGFTADLVVLDKNPLKAIDHMQSIYAVVKTGNLINQKEIKERLISIQEYNRHE